MAKLSSAARKAMPKSEFGLPGSRGYPMPDKSHAANAKARATQAVKAGRMSAGTEAKIDAKASKVLGNNRSTTQRREDARRGHDRKHGRALTNRLIGK